MTARLALLTQLETVLNCAECGSPPLPDQAQQWVAESQADPRLHGMALDILGHAHQHFSQHHAAQIAFREAAASYRQAGQMASSTNSLLLLATSYLLNEQPLLALDQWTKALLQAKSAQNLGQCVRIYLGIGQVYIGFQDDEAALRCSEMALKMAVAIADPLLECDALLYVASDNYRLQRYAQALEAIARAERLMEIPLHNKVWAAEIVYYRGLIHGQQGMLQQAKVELATAYDLHCANDNLWGKAHALTGLGEVLLQLQDSQAEEILLQAQQMTLQAGLLILQTRCCKALIDCYLAKQQAERALPFYAQLFAQQSAPTWKISPTHRQKIVQLETQSRVLQLQKIPATLMHKPI
ncbi:hypothetical protein [Deefgea salmonis]|uniref:Tetratricopeptide repeat protein n=1 Tax=Deefgea salmonis TaxID=2875502 RepID=A0ABS8BM61_9NEIS|nr:hypothetical protein [Deefgea salmonis]MCB5196611.1 hypothetical protein [Deefgea salmonis]